MVAYLYLVTAIGVVIAAPANDGWEIVDRTLSKSHLTSIAVSGDVLLVGSREGAWRSDDNGDTWQDANEGLATRHVRWIAPLPSASGAFLAGTEPAGIFNLSDGGNRWIERSEVAAMRDRFGWYLPYSPGAGCVRGFAVAGPGSEKQRVYAAAEVGGVLVSDDAGQTWRLAGGSDGKPDLSREPGTQVHPDVHSITVHPSSPDLVTAATGGGLYRSVDGGDTWTNIYRCYIRAVWVDPADPRHMIAGPADGVSRNGRIEETFDGGDSWKPAQGAPPGPWPAHMVERFTPIGSGLFAVLSNGELWHRESAKDSGWRKLFPELDGIRAVVGRE